MTESALRFVRRLISLSHWPITLAGQTIRVADEALIEAFFDSHASGIALAPNSRCLTISEIIVSVLPRPISSARMPPKEYKIRHDYNSLFQARHRLCSSQVTKIPKLKYTMLHFILVENLINCLDWIWLRSVIRSQASIASDSSNQDPNTKKQDLVKKFKSHNFNYQVQ